MVLSLITTKCAKTREPKDKCCVLQCTNIYIYATPYP